MVRMKQLPSGDVAQRLRARSSDVWQVHTEAVARASAGEDIILLSVGDPDFPTPSFITAEVVRSLDAGRTHYSPAAGEDRLRSAIAELETRLTGHPLEPEQFVIFPGATAALFCVLGCIANPGDRVIVPEPAYIGYQGIFDALGVEQLRVPTTGPTFDLDPQALLDAIDDRTVAVLVNTPGNPSGRVVPPDHLAQLADVCRSRGIWIISDEVYSLIYFDTPHISMLRAADTLDNVVVIDGLSKSHAMSGWRIGWAVAPPDLAQDLANFTGAAFFGCSQFVQDAAAYALTHDEPQVDAMREAYRERRDYVIERIRPLNVISAESPQAGMFVMIHTPTDGDVFARQLLDEVGISTIPGSGFGATTRQYVRVGLTQDMATLERAFDRIERWLSSAD